MQKGFRVRSLFYVDWLEERTLSYCYCQGVIHPRIIKVPSLILVPILPKSSPIHSACLLNWFILFVQIDCTTKTTTKLNRMFTYWLTDSQVSRDHLYFSPKVNRVNMSFFISLILCPTESHYLNSNAFTHHLCNHLKSSCCSSNFLTHTIITPFTEIWMELNFASYPVKGRGVTRAVQHEEKLRNSGVHATVTGLWVEDVARGNGGGREKWDWWMVKKLFHLPLFTSLLTINYLLTHCWLSPIDYSRALHSALPLLPYLLLYNLTNHLF